tara:strand:- start:1484 stop:3028 length:1545 start_codon:yes stop_codon:yes gene_type:complete
VFDGILSITIFLPVISAVIILFFLKNNNSIRYFANFTTGIVFILSLLMFLNYDTESSGFQMIDFFEAWIPFDYLRSSYIVGIDGLSAPLVLLTGILGFVSTLASFRVEKRVKEYHIWLLVLISSVFGVFVSLDLLLFFIFFEFELIPMYMLISIWGSGRPKYSAMKFVLFTLFGGALMLVAILSIYMSADVGTLIMVSIPELNIVGIPDLIQYSDLLVPASFIFLLFFIAFAIKLPSWPLHSWLPDAHTDAPTAVSVMLAGVLLKMAGYGLIRINIGFFQNTKGFTVYDVSIFISIIAAISVVYGGIITVRQTDMKRLIAFSSISHMGFVMLGVSAIGTSSSNTSIAGINGAALQMFTHGTITGLAFLMVGYTYERTHTRHIPHLGGLWHKIPLIAVFFFISGFASLGLPMLSGFVSEIMIFLSTFTIWPIATIISAFGVVLAAGYILWMIQRIFFGVKPPDEIFSDEIYNQIEDVKKIDLLPILLLTIPVFLVGIWPSFLTEIINLGVEGILR